MAYYFVSCPKLNYLICIKRGLWGAKINKIRKWKEGDKLLFFVDKNLAAIAEVIGNPFYDEAKIWPDDLYPYRIKIKFKHILQDTDWIPIDEVKDILIEEHGRKWGMCLVAVLPQTERIFRKLSRKILSKKNYTYINIDLRIEQLQRQITAVKKTKGKRSRKIKGATVTQLPQRGYRGPVINFRGLVYAPVEENGVIFLFSKIAEDIGIFIEGIQKGFPDAFGVRYVGEKGYPVNIEFEYKSSNFKFHNHNPKDCDIIICWEHDWKECPVEIIELKETIKKLK